MASETEPRLRWLLLDLNSYFASVEHELHPELRGRPNAVVPVQADTTCAIAASYEAKVFGVLTGTRVGDAKQMCVSGSNWWKPGTMSTLITTIASSKRSSVARRSRRCCRATRQLPA